MVQKARSTRSASAKIGSTFARAAVGPIEYAAGLVTGNKIQAALAELSADGLGGAFDRGVADVAKLIGLRKGDVEACLPMTEVAAVRARLAASHPAALEAWRMHAGQFGFLDVITALTVDGRSPDIRTCLERVAGKVRADKTLARPLEALSADVAEWSDLVERSRALLEDGRWLSDALRKRRILIGLALLVPIVLLVTLTTAIVYIRISRERLDGLLAGDDPCTAETITSTDLRFASSTQLAAQRERRDQCNAAREAQAAREKAAREQLAQEEKLRAAAVAREAACVALATEVERGTLTEASRTLAGGAAPLLDRVAARALDPVDVGPEPPAFPCDKTPAYARLEAAFVGALLADVSVWTRRGDPSSYVSAALLARRDEVPDNARLGLADNAERTAKAGLTGGDQGKLARAKRLCTLARGLGVPGHTACSAVEAM